MRRLSFLLRPTWLAVIALSAVFAYFAFAVLAPWQLGKNTDNSARNKLIEASMEADPVPLSQVYPDGRTSAGAEDEWRRVQITGQYVADEQVLVRLRSVNADPTFEVVAPFVTDEGQTILVDRGYVYPAEEMAAPEIDPPPTGTVTLNARIRPGETRHADREPFVRDGWQQVYSIAPERIGPLFGRDDLLGDYLQLDEDQPGSLGLIQLPQLDSGPYLSYGLQWIAFGIMVPLGIGYFVWAEIRERRREAAALAPTEDGSPAAAGGPDDGPDGDGPAPDRAPVPAGAAPPAADQAGAAAPRPAADAPFEDDLAHVAAGKRRRKAPQPMAYRSAEPLPEAQRRTIQDRYEGRRQR